MADNTFGTHFRITTWGESHGRAIGAVIDGCPAGLAIDAEEIDAELARRAPGKSPYTSPRKEADRVQILSGIFEGQTTGAPLSLLIENRDANPKAYDPIRHLVRPGHAQKSYQDKYGHHDHRGGGRASARETAARVACGAVAKKLLAHWGIEVIAYLRELGGIGIAPPSPEEAMVSRSSPLFCPDPSAEKEMRALLEKTIAEGDSLGGVVEMVALGNTQGLGDPIYQKLEALLAYAMMSLPASKGFEVGSGFSSARMRGSLHNTRSEGIVGGIGTGEAIVCRVAFKPTSTIAKPQPTVDFEGNPATLHLPPGSRHDPCVAIRAVPVVEAMGRVVLTDRYLANRLSRSEEKVPCS